MSSPGVLRSNCDRTRYDISLSVAFWDSGGHLDDVGISGDEYWEARAREFRRALGESVRHLRERLGESQETFAERAEVHRTHVGMIENARIEPRLSTLLKLAQALGVELHELLRQAGRRSGR